MLALTEKTEPQYPFSHDSRRREYRMIAKAIADIEAVGSAQHILDDYLQDDWDAATFLLDFLLDDPNEIYFSFGHCLQGAFGRHDPEQINRAINLLLRLGIIKVHGDLRQDRNTVVFVMNPRYDTWYATV